MLTVFFRPGKTRKKVHGIVTVMMLMSVGLNLLVPLSALAVSATADQSLQSQEAIETVESNIERSVEAALPASMEQPILGTSVLTITKSVVNSSNAGPYAITVNGPDGYLQNTTVLSTTPTVLTGLANGIYTVTETSPGAGWTTTYTATTGYSTGSSAVVTLTNGSAVANVAPGNITGTVFKDFSSDGVRNTSTGGDIDGVKEPGVISVTVTAYDINGAACVATDTDAQGAYTITSAALSGCNGPWRLEFSNLPNGTYPSAAAANNKTATQFVNSVPSSGNDLGIVDPTWCYAASGNPLLCIANFTPADPNLAPVSTIGSVYASPYLLNSNAGGDGSTFANYNPNTSRLINQGLSGAVWGLGYDRDDQTLFASAFMKRHAGLGALGIGGIYTANVTNSTYGSTGVYVDVRTLGIQVDAPSGLYNVPDNGTRGLLVTTSSDATIDNTGIWQVGKVGIGDIEVDEANHVLYFTNLYQRTVHGIRIGSPLKSTLSASDAFTVTNAPWLSNANCTAGLERPFATKVYGRKLYIGTVCTGEDVNPTGTNTWTSPYNQLTAQVYAYDLTGETWSLAFGPHNLGSYRRGDFFPGYQTNWLPWTDRYTEWTARPIGGGSGTQFTMCGHPSPILSDIEFDEDGSMILSFTDRASHQSGHRNNQPLQQLNAAGDATESTGAVAGDLCNNSGGGDLLRTIFDPVSGQWTMESNGQAGPYAATGTNGDNGSLQGPGGAEFFWNDVPQSNTSFHEETSNGAVSVLLGLREVAASAYDPFDLDSTGYSVFDSTTGSFKRGVELAANGGVRTNIFAKAGGTGDIEVLCDPRPIEIGNRVWDDRDSDGVQDAGEPGLSGVQVTLTNPDDSTIDTTTDVNGNYVFTREATTGTYSTTLRANGNYTVTINSTPSGYSLTTPNAEALSGASVSSNHAISDVRDSDGVLVSNVATIYYTTGSAGQNNHGLDFGFTKPAYGQVDILNVAPELSLGNRVWFDSDDNGQMDGSEVGTSGVVLSLLDSDGQPVLVGGQPYTTTTDANGYYTFTNLLSDTYKVRVDALNFQAGGVLENYLNSDPSEADPNADSDLNDNGINPATLADYLSDGVVSGPIVLSYGDEPNGEDHLGAADSSAMTNYTLDFGFYQLSVGDLVWNDINNNGEVDSGEPVLSNVTVTLLSNSGAVLATTTTDGSGLYTFTNLISGTYVISITPPAGYVSSTPTTNNDSSNNTDHGIASGDFIVSQPFALTPGGEPTVDNPVGSTHNPTLDFGLWQPLEVGNRVWRDNDNGGDIDAGELGLAGVTLSLLDDSGNPVISTVTGAAITTTTDAGGYYTFTNLISGTYQVQVDASNFAAGGALANYLSSTPTEADPNADSDSNDNGIDPASPAAYLSDGVVSGLFDLSVGNEPTNEENESSTGLADANSNLSVDFGFLLYDWGDLPNEATATNSPIYHTKLDEGGASHIVIPGLSIGSKEDGEVDGQPTASANGDDSSLSDDEEGVTLPAFIAGQDAVVTVSVVNTTGADAYLYGFIDLNGDGDFDDSGESVSALVPGDGSVSSVPLTYTVPIDADISQLLGARFRLSSDDDLTANGATPDGEVEDYLIRVAQYDFGDLPSGYPTLTSENGAGHAISPDLYFGAGVDNESNGQPSTLADGDDQNGTTDDEDGIVFMTPLMPNTNATISVTAYVTPGLTAYYGAFIDFNGDGDFGDVGEVITGTVVNGENSINLTVPGVVSDTLYSRFRLSTDPAAISIPTGEAPDGEVEDYVLMSLGNQLWFDNGTGTANNGIFDAGEEPVPAGVTLTLVVSGTTTPIATTTTDANGNYLFSGLPEGDYQVIVAAENFQPGGLLEGYLGSTGADSGDAIDNNDNGADVADPALTGIASNGVTLTLGDEPTDDGNGSLSNLTVDFGFYKLMVGNLVWNDSNNNGKVDSGEPVLSGITVTLLSDSRVALATTTTDSSGLYTFTDLISGSYVISITPPAGYVSSTSTTSDDSGNNTDHGDASGNFIVSQPFVLTPGAGTGTNEINDLVNSVTYNPNLDFGLWQPLSLGNRVWFDTNNDGTQNGSEVGVAGVSLTLLDGSGNPVTSTVTGAAITAVTDASGYYTFTDLISGTYKVQVNGSNFQAGAKLANYQNSSFSEANADANVDTRDNGINPANVAGYLSNGVVSAPVALNADTEPTGEEHLGASDSSTSSNLTVDFGFYQLSVGDLVWNDSNNNGKVDSGESVLSGITVTLLSGSGTVLATTTTDANGLYTFTNLISGTYVISVTPPAGYVSSTPTTSDDSGNNTDHGAASGDFIVSQPFALTPGGEPTVDNPVGSTSNPNLDFGLWQPLNLGNLVWYDANNNGLVDNGESGIAGVTLQLFKEGDDPTTATALLTTTTDANGNYTFTNLLPGSYFVYIPNPPAKYPASSSLTDTADNGQDNDDNGSQTAFGQPVTSPVIELKANSEVSNDGDGSNGDLTIDFGFFAPASLGDLVWFDSDKDGVQDSVETGIPGSTDAMGIAGVLVTLFRADDSVVATTTTDIHGNYLFEGLTPGDYYVEFAPPAGYQVSPSNVVTGTDSYDSDGLRTAVTSLSSGEYDPTLDLGLYLDVVPASIGDIVWFDANNNGVQDTGESGIPGVTVTLYRADGTAVASTTTDVNGNYFFGDLIPGDYFVQFTAPTGLTPSPKDAGTDDAADSDADSITGKTAVTSLVAGENDPTWDAGFFSSTPLASIGDTVWYDSNANGIQDSGETGVPGVVVKLYDGSGNLVASTTTDSAGHYSFGNLVPGDYSLEFVVSDAYILTDPDMGSNDGLDSDVDPETGKTTVTTLVAGENDPSWDLGIYVGDVKGVVILPVSLGNRVWNDVNKDGIQDAGEVGIPGVTVKLYNGQGELIATLLTDSNGEYSFNNLPPGDYYIEFVPPVGYIYSPTDTAGNEVTDSDMDHGTGRTPIVSMPPGSTTPNLDAGFFLSPTGEQETGEPSGTKSVYLPVISR